MNYYRKYKIVLLIKNLFNSNNRELYSNLINSFSDLKYRNDVFSYKHFSYDFNDLIYYKKSRNNI